MRQIIIACSIFLLMFITVSRLTACTIHSTRKTVRTTDKVLMGEPVKIGSGTARSWIALDNTGRPKAIGIILDEAAMTGLPAANPMYEYVLALPKGAPKLVFDHIAIDWNPRGHIPPGIYDIPHFDFHFYMITEAERDRITAAGDDLKLVEKVPQPQYIPIGYRAFPGGEPRMGSHWYDPNTPELHGGKFTRTFLYGFYDGKMVFIEPMITLAYFQAKPNVTESIALPEDYQTPGYYPTNYTVRYEPNTKTYTIALGGMVLR